MTGEVSLRGKVLQVGGLREKALAAYRAGFRAMLYPAVNEKDLDDVPVDVRERLQLIPVDTMDEVFEIALHRVILPSRLADGFIIEVDDDEEEASTGEANGAEAHQSARGRRRRG
jgi:ATP-dependent Lon protease